MSNSPPSSILCGLITLNEFPIMPLPRIMSQEDNLPPAEGPFDEDDPLLHNEEDAKPKKHVLGTAVVLLVFTLLITTVAFASLYFHLLRDKGARLPKWPKPSLSPLGKYSTAAVAADNEYCSEIGRNTLLRGGNAVDAAIAALFCIGVMDSHSSGIGGGHFMNIFNATTQKCTVVDAREVAPQSATEEMFKGKWMDSQIGWRAVAVPGELHGMWTEYTQFGSGKISWSKLIEPTIELMEEGFPTSHALAKALAEKADIIMNETTMHEFLNPSTGKVYRVGDQIKTRKTLLETLRKLANASDPVKKFYTGEMAKTMAKEFKEKGGLISLEDLANYRSIVHKDDDVIYSTLRNGRSICGAPPPSGAAVSMAILGAMDGYNYSTKSFKDISLFYHHFIEASKFAYSERSWLGDPAFVKNATAIARNITTPEWAEWVRSKITDRTHPDAYYGGSFQAAPEDHGTTHISIVDAEGNVVSVTSTIDLHLGALVASPSLGILWNDEMDDFSTPGHPNYFGFPPSPANFIRPGKRPMSSQSPLIIFDKKKTGKKQTLMAVGGAGGSTIISGVAGVALHAMWLNADVKQAVDSPRLHNQLRPNYTRYEHNFPKAYITDLRSRGHDLRPVDNLTVITAIDRPKDGQLYANSDFRKGEESAPAGY